MQLEKEKNCTCAGAPDAACAGECRTRPKLTFRQERQIAALIFLAFMLFAGLVAAIIGGCAQTVEHRSYATDPMLGNQGGAWEVVMPTPIVASSPSYANLDRYPEYSRNDENLSNRPPTAQLASAQWPEAPRADLAFPRYIDLEPRARTLLYFQPTGAYGPAPYGSGPVYNGPSGQYFYYPVGR